MKTHILTVTQLTHQIKNLLEGTFPDVWVEGEVSNLSIAGSGHAYFTLKDAQSQVRGVLFRSSLRFLKFTLQHGMTVICRGRVSVYEPRGEYQFLAEYVEPKGVGALQLAFEQLKAKLEQEGLFDAKGKKPIPLLPSRIGIITSPAGAAIHDILRVIRRRHPRMRILIYPVPVQGPEAAPRIIEAIRYFNKEQNADVIIAGRGGGSLEDLWAFNEESLARAIFASKIPVISAVGHETDYTIADFVSDLRAPTPSAAAEMVVKTEESFRDLFCSLESAAVNGIRRKLDVIRSSLREYNSLLRDPRRALEQYTQRVDDLNGRLTTGINHHLKRDRAIIASLASALGHLNPLSILSRGYSVTRKIRTDEVLKEASGVEVEELISTTLFRGVVFSRVEKIETETESNNFGKPQYDKL